VYNEWEAAPRHVAHLENFYDETKQQENISRDILELNFVIPDFALNDLEL
jgi:hypothetical protein